MKSYSFRQGLCRASSNNQPGWLSSHSTCCALPWLEWSKIISSGIYKVIWSECIQHYQSCFISTVPRPN